MYVFNIFVIIMCAWMLNVVLQAMWTAFGTAHLHT